MNVLMPDTQCHDCVIMNKSWILGIKVETDKQPSKSFIKQKIPTTPTSTMFFSVISFVFVSSVTLYSKVHKM